ncbi:hypothetical protein PROFUN_01814 [Planoprotostelium fungivorum]|uniref:Succinate dehydrogenase assembly factor 2, mitochondrial n=1 Tax=Planoprotostelium fungivorum TaxID=1890364 RepID=A0A2P6NYR4_9EUKA|nr:hypothetical protein PROFUN_01814 [Planoprotostelium fungivorum]
MHRWFICGNRVGQICSESSGSKGYHYALSPLENDLILGTFADLFLQKMDEKQLKEYETILATPDIDLFNFLTKKEQVPDHLNGPVFSMIQEHILSNPLKYQSTFRNTT